MKTDRLRTGRSSQKSFTPQPDFVRFSDAVTRRRIPDRVPIAENGIDFEVMDAFLGERVNDLKRYVRFWKEAGYDYILLEIRSQFLADSFQVKISEGVRQGEPRRESTVFTGGSIITDEEGFRRYPWTKPEEVYYRDIDLVRGYLPDGMKVILCIGPLYNGIPRAMGMDAFVSGYAENPSLVREVADMFGTSIVRIVENVLQREWVGGVWLGDDIAYNTGLLISPGFLREFIFPYYAAVGELCQRAGKLYIYHSDGDKTSVFQDLAECGIQAVHPNEPLACQIETLKREWGDRFAFIGNIDVDLLERGSCEAVEAAVTSLIQRMAPGGGFVLGSGNSITRRVPIRNYRALLEAARNHGSY